MKAQITTKSPVNHVHTAVAFYRVSLQNMETDRQKEDVQRYCNAFGWNIIQEFEEKVSGKAELKDRKELQSFMKYVEIHKPDYCIVSELSRIGRSNLTLLIIEQLTKMKICFVSLKENLKTLNDDKTINPSTQLLIDILNGINKFELETIKYRVKSGLHKTISSGTWSGGNAPFGYDIEGKKSMARLVINSDSETVKMIFEKYADNWGTHKIASHLNGNGILTKTGVQWKDTSINKILNNSIYCGKRMWLKETIDMPELQIISEGLFLTVKERLEKNANTTDLNKHNKYDYLLQGKITCACGKRYVGQGRHNIYMCASKKYAGGCDTKSVKIDWLENQIKDNLIKHEAELLHDNTKLLSKVGELSAELQMLQDNVKSEKRTQNALLKQIGILPENVFETKYNESVEYVGKIQSRIEEIEKKLNQNKQAEFVFIKAKFELEAGQYKRKELIIEKEVLQKIIDTISIDNEKVVVTLSNTNTFTIKR
jgi:site-specific DNA recombinase